METRANFVLIGAFTLAVIAGAFGLVLWFAAAGRVTDSKSYEVLFSGSVSGLARGAAVLFNGLRVGEVVGLDFVPNDPGHVEATVIVESRIPIKRDTKARLELQGLTGGSAVALSGGAPDAPPLVGVNGAPPVIIAEPSQIQNLLENVQGISEKADAVLAKADKLMSENSVAVADAIKNIDTFTKALGDSSSGVSGAISGIGEIGRKIGPLAQRLEGLTDDVDKLVQAVDPVKVKKVVGDVATFTGALADSKAQIQSVLADASTLAKRLNEAGGHLDGAITDIDAVVKAVDTKKIANVMEGASGIGDVLKENKGNVDRAIKNAAELAAKLNAAADKIDGLMTTVQGFLGSGDTKGPLAEVGSAARSIRVLADDLNTRTKDISAGLTRFTGPGLREYEALAVDGRRTINDFDRVLHSLERNPSQLIFGAKPSLPEYHGGN
jgi:phospholipid/cholesterol/gamma-HCH transport system substrate-binding protein